MRCTKSHESFIKVLQRTSFYGLWNLWKKDVDWDRKLRKEKNICIWFALSFLLMFALCATPLFLAAIVNFGVAYISMKNYNIKVEE